MTAPQSVLNAVARIKERWIISLPELTDDETRMFLDIYEGVYSLFRSPEREQRFIRVSEPKLGGVTLVDLIGARRFDEAKSFVDWFNGRS